MSDDDVELLKLAARAANLDVYLSENGTFLLRNVLNPLANRSWNPLEDDGDALRLAVVLDLMVMIGSARDCQGRLSLDSSEDDYAATRRAIVLAAAEIGRTMQT